MFVTREPVVHQPSGSTTYALGLLKLLKAQGAEVTLVATAAYSRSPRLFFRATVDAGEGVQLCFPGYLRVGRWYVLPFRLKAWARALARMAARRAWLRPLSRLFERMYRAALYTEAWDLTPPTQAECAVARRAIKDAAATTVIVNYCFWGPLLSEGQLPGCRTAILMHDLLSARVRRFRAGGLPLDCPEITEAEEMRLLCCADTVLAAQEREAEAVRPHVSGTVLVTPIVLESRVSHAAEAVQGRCLFLGSNIPPNQMGLRFLLEAVWPRVRAEVPGATLAVAGSVGDSLSEAEKGRLRGLGAEVLGLVPALQDEYARAAICVVPLLVGTGIKIKLVEALGFGKAVVSTSIGVQGLEGWAAEAIEVADDAGAFAHAIVRLLKDEKLRHSRESAALRLADEHFGHQRALAPEFKEALL